ncbi:hypothetical protein [Cohnella panacarvi]|uniref:hypothetical protein n=1 Tax=Cohnella panacarvi TaxID=400776 RepID=UPI0004798557|nr:hypothetical protein [Cohnella panacarvi]
MNNQAELQKQLLNEIEFAHDCFQTMQRARQQRSHLESQKTRHDKFLASLNDQLDKRPLVYFFICLVIGILFIVLFGAGLLTLIIGLGVIGFGVIKYGLRSYKGLVNRADILNEQDEQKRVIKLYKAQIDEASSTEASIREEVRTKCDIPIGYVYPEALRRFESYVRNYEAFTVDHCISLYEDGKHEGYESSVAENRRNEEIQERKLNQEHRERVEKQLKKANDELKEEVSKLRDQVHRRY